MPSSDAKSNVGAYGGVFRVRKKLRLRRHPVGTPGLFAWSPKVTLAISVDTCGVARRRGARTAPSYEFGLTTVAATGLGELGQTPSYRVVSGAITVSVLRKDGLDPTTPG